MFDDSIPADGILVVDNNLPYERSPRPVDKVRYLIRCKYYRNCAKHRCFGWMMRYIFFLTILLIAG